MCAERLKNAPLVEVIVEVRWAPKEPQPSRGFDLNYNLLVGKLSEVFRDKYPEYEALPNLEVPARLAAENHLVQHRLRASKEGWPLIQVGPTVFTINQTEEYDWDNEFRQRAIQDVERFFEAYPKREEMAVQSVLLRYIDAIKFDWAEKSLWEFLREELHSALVLPDALYADTGVDPKPEALDFRASFRCDSPAGKVHLRLASGQSRGEKALILETMVESAGDNVPELPSRFEPWIDDAHRITSDWFKRLTKGKLYRSFQGD